MWQRNFKHVVIPVQPRQAKCDVCTSLHELLHSPNTPTSTKHDMRGILEAHRNSVVKERQMYWLRRDMAVTNPSMFASFIMDGMDQTATSLPNYNPRVRKVLPAQKFHIFSVLNHGSKCSHFFVCHEGIRKDSNLSITALLWTLQSMPQPWSPVLYLQVCIARYMLNID